MLENKAPFTLARIQKGTDPFRIRNDLYYTGDGFKSAAVYTGNFTGTVPLNCLV